MPFQIQQSTSNSEYRKVPLHLVSSTDGTTALTGQTGTCKLSRNYGTPFDSTNSIVEVNSVTDPGLYYLQLTAAEVSTFGYLQIRYKSASSLEFQDVHQIIAYDPYTRTPVFNAWQDIPGAGAAGADVNYKKIAKIVAEEIAKLPQPEVKQPELVDLGPLQAQLRAIQTSVAGISIPDQKETDVTPLTSRLDSIQSALSAIQLPETDLSPVHGQLEALRVELEAVRPDLQNAQSTLEEMLQRVREFYTTDIDSVKAEVAALSKKLDNVSYMVLQKGPTNDA